MEYRIAHGEVHAPGTRHPQLRSLATVMAAAAFRSIGTKIGASLAVRGQRLIKDLRQPKS